MSDTSQTLDQEQRRDELTQQFSDLPPETARSQIEVLPYYHQLQNEITKPNQGAFVGRYFQTRWRPSLGAEAASLILAMRICADKNDGTTYASQQTIARTAGMSLRSAQRWLSQNPPTDRSDEWKQQWALLHTYFIKAKSARYLIRREGNLSRAKRTTSLYRVAMDDPIHPEDQPLLIEKAALRIARKETENRDKSVKNADISYNRPTGGNRAKTIIHEENLGVDNSSYNRPIGGQKAPPVRRSLSSSYRSTNNVDNVRQETSKDQRSGRETSFIRSDQSQALVVEIVDRLTQMDPDSEPKKNLKLYQLIVDKMPPAKVQEALVAVRDAKDERKIKKSAPKLFWGIIRNMAREQGIELTKSILRNN